MSKTHKLRLAPVEPQADPEIPVAVPTALSTLEEVRAARDVAADRLLHARIAVQGAVDAFGGPMARRSIIEEMRPSAARAGYPRPIDHTRSDRAEATLDLYAAFDLAVAAETEAQRAADAASADLEAVERWELGDGRRPLAEAIRAAAERQAEADAARANAERARGGLVRARMVHDKAEAALADAREAAIGAATAADGVQPVGLKDLRRAAADALDDVDIASEAAARAEAALADPAYAERSAREKVDEAARAVLAEAAAPMADALDDLMVRFKAPMLSRINYLLAALPSFFSSAFSPEQQRRARVESMRSAVAHLGPPVSLSDLGIPRGADLYETALAALKADAAAPIPELP